MLMNIFTQPLILWLLVFVCANLGAYGIMYLDKKRAIEGARRISEKALLNWAFFGGAFGARVAQQKLRHKTYKQPFKNILLGCVIWNGLFWVFIFGRLLWKLVQG